MLYDLILNLLFILVGIFAQHLWADKTGDYQSKVILTVVSSITISLCIQFRIYESFLPDLAFIPYIIGGLYGGLFVAAILFIFMMLASIFLYGLTTSIFSFVLIFALLGFVCGLLSKKFLKSKMSEKLLLMTCIAYCYTVAMFLLKQGDEINLLNTLLFLNIPAIAMLIIGYIMESIRGTIVLRQQIFKSEKSEIVSQLAASVSHEVRNPLTVTRGFLQLVLEDENLPPEKRSSYIKLAIEELDTASNIINDYLTFAKPAPTNWELLDIKVHLQQIEDIILTYANMNSVKLDTEFATCVIQGNKQQFHQCFLNITKNCIEAMPQGGLLTIYTSIFQKHVLIEISDTGIGMTEEQINRIGEPYFSTKEKGTGLGMMVVFGIVKAMKGTISIQSKVGTGTKISIRFPIAIPQ
ncbi:sensor histidine kinase [Metabacillus litoralis]|uniref:sensor histidine kinase n=1 Tax=Metabacillus litoralis TaxID=152268 RepID=UPI001CFCD008|nr:HAMP domain-containing sensor histidine kinase [Metabacillus litoralis]